MINPSMFSICIYCLTYNHSQFIEQALNGFAMQKTSFPYICLIVDDYSSDGAQDIINKYLLDHFDTNDSDNTLRKESEDYSLTIARHISNANCYFAIYNIKYNHYSKGKKKQPYYWWWSKDVKYSAICEGDDYWIDPLKLQKQVDFLEGHPDYTMICNRTLLYSEKRKEYIGENYCYNKDQDVSAHDTIKKGGLFISTCSIVYRTSIKEDYPLYCKNCEVGDYPLQIMAAMKGKIYYFNKPMSVYRVENNNSWMGHLKWSEDNLMRRIKIIQSEIDMLNGFAKDYPQYSQTIKDKIAMFVNKFIPSRKTDRSITKRYLKEFRNIIDDHSLFQKIDYYLCVLPIPMLRRLRKLYLHNYSSNNIYYKK